MSRIALAGLGNVFYTVLQMTNIQNAISKSSINDLTVCYTSVLVVINNNTTLYRNKILHNRATHFVDRTFLSRNFLYHDTAYYSSVVNEMYNAFSTYNSNNTATKFRTVKHLARRPAVLYYYNRRSQSSLQYYYLPSERKRPSWRGGRCRVLHVTIYCLHTI